MKLRNFLLRLLLAAMAVFCAATLHAQQPPAGGGGVVTPGSGSLQQVTGMPWQFAGVWNFMSTSTATAGFNVKGILYYKFLFVKSGTVGACALSFDSATSVDVNGALVSPVIGGIISAGTIGSCANSGTYITPAAITPTLLGQITPTITGSGSVTLVVFGYTENPAVSSGASSNVSVTNFPANQVVSGTVTATNPSVGTTGAAVPASGTAIAGKNGSGNLQDVSTDASGNVGVNVQNNLSTLNAQPAATSGTITGTACPGIGCVSVASSGYGIAAFSFHGTYAGITVIFEFSDDGGTTWYTNTCSPSTSNTLVSTVVLGTNASNSYDCGAYATTNVRVRATAFGSGTATVNVTPSAVNVEPAAAVAAIVTDNAGNGIGSTGGGLNVSGVGNFNTQPSGFASLLGGQQAVTASAVALPTNSTHGVCVKALSTNTIDVFVGPSGVTTGTGFPLSAGDPACYQLSNSNLLFVIASTTGASVSWTAN